MPKAGPDTTRSALVPAASQAARCGRSAKRRTRGWRLDDHGGMAELHIPEEPKKFHGDKLAEAFVHAHLTTELKPEHLAKLGDELPGRHPASPTSPSAALGVSPAHH